MSIYVIWNVHGFIRSGSMLFCLSYENYLRPIQDNESTSYNSGDRICIEIHTFLLKNQWTHSDMYQNYAISLSVVPDLWQEVDPRHHYHHPDDWSPGGGSSHGTAGRHLRSQEAALSRLFPAAGLLSGQRFCQFLAIVCCFQIFHWGPSREWVHVLLNIQK